jgi:hypothetical protein
MRLSRLASSLLILTLFAGCATTKLPIPKIEYVGPQLPVTSVYSIKLLGEGSTIFTIESPDSEKILVNLYDPEGLLYVTLYQGRGGVMALSLAMIGDKYGFDLKPGVNKIVLYGEKGKFEFFLKAQEEEY